MESKISFNPYDVLGLKENCNEKEIQKAYKLQCLRWHPDKNLNNKEEAETRFIAAKEAFEFLFDKSKRNKYDQHTRNARMQEERHKARLEKADSTRRKFIDDLRQREKEFADRHTVSEKLTPSQEESRRRKQEWNIRAEFEELRMKLEKEVSDEIHAQQERLNKVRQEASEAEQPRIKTGATLRIKWNPSSSTDYDEDAIRILYKPYGNISTIFIRTTKKGGKVCVIEFEEGSVPLEAELETGQGITIKGDWINPPSSVVSEYQKTQEDSVDNGISSMSYEELQSKLFGDVDSPLEKKSKKWHEEE